MVSGGRCLENAVSFSSIYCRLSLEIVIAGDYYFNMHFVQ